MTYRVSIPTYSFGRSNVAVRAYPIQSNPIQSNTYERTRDRSHPLTMSLVLLSIYQDIHDCRR